MSRDIPTTLTPAEQQAHQNGELRVLIRAAEKCERCDGTAAVYTRESGWRGCPVCGWAGFAPNPLGNKGDVLVHTVRPDVRNYAAMVERMGEFIRLPRTDEGRLVRLQVYVAASSLQVWVEPMNADDFKRDWDLSNPDTPWASNPWVYVGGVEK